MINYNQQMVTTIRRDPSQYDDTALERAPHIDLGRRVDDRPDGWTADVHEEIYAALQDHAEGSTGATVAELRRPASALLAPMSEDLRTELESLGWADAPGFEPLENVAGLIYWTRRDSGGDVIATALHLLNQAEFNTIEKNTLSLALDRIWDLDSADTETTTAAVQLLQEVLRNRNWNTSRDRDRIHKS